MRAQVEEQLSQSQLSDPDQPGGFAQNTGTGSEPSRTQGPPPGIPPPSARYVDEIEHQQEQAAIANNSTGDGGPSKLNSGAASWDGPRTYTQGPPPGLEPQAGDDKGMRYSAMRQQQAQQ